MKTPRAARFDFCRPDSRWFFRPATGCRLLVLIALQSAVGWAGDLPELSARFGTAVARTEGDELIVTTGTIERRWRRVPAGLQTATVRHHDRDWVAPAAAAAPDWNYPGWIGAGTPAVLRSLTARESDDDGFTSRHLAVTAEFDYPDSGTTVRYEIWAWPGADGLRTQLRIRGGGVGGAAEDAPGFHLEQGPAGRGRSDQARERFLRVTGLDSDRRYELELQPATDGGAQSVELLSVDGESRQVVAADWRGSPLRAELSPALRPDGSVTIRVRGVDGPARVAGARLRGAGEETPVLATIDVLATEAARTAGPASAPAQTDFLPAVGATWRAIGYFNDTQHRHQAGTPLLRDEVVPAGETAWASILCAEDDRGGLAVVKESHKCVNQPGVDTGAFEAGPDGIRVTGWGLGRDDARPGEFRWCWATWTVAYATPTADARELALKRFDRVRYPVRADLDLYLKANTWGSGDNSAESVARASETEVLAEIDSVADLGLDVLQIDDGWQTGRMTPPPPADREWTVRPDWYPEGWKNVVARAHERGLRLGVWHAARAPLPALRANFAAAGFTSWKLDFADLSRYDALAANLAKARAFIDYTRHRVRVNWDVTENAPRYGYFWARECGNIWLANRKPRHPANVVAQPWLMLRDVWHLARYANLNKFELPVVNPAAIDPDRSDASRHSATYATALGLGGIPVFFQTTRLLTPAQRAEIRTLLDAYRGVRADLFAAYAFPIGDEPSNRGWSGFQWYDPASPRVAYLLLFRERLNEEPARRLALRFLPSGATVRVSDLRTGAVTSATLGPDAAFPAEIAAPGDIRLLRLDLP